METTYHVTKREPCYLCEGAGSFEVKATHSLTCPPCRGTGYTETTTDLREALKALQESDN